MPLNLLALPPYVNTDQIHELNRGLSQLEHLLNIVAEDRLGDLQWPAGPLKADQVHAIYDRQETTFTSILAAAQHVYESLEAPRLPADIRTFAKSSESIKLGELIGHTRNIRVHWAKNHKYFSSTHPVSPPDHRDTRSVRWYIAAHPKKYPMLTYNRGGIYIIGNTVSLKKLTKQMVELRTLLGKYYN